MSDHHHIQATSFGQSSTNADTFVIELSNTNLSFCEINSLVTCPIYVSNFPIEVNANQALWEYLLIALNHFGFSKKNYKTVLINIADTNFTLCPTSFYESDTARSLLEFNCGDIGEHLVLTDDVSSAIKLIYSIDERLKSTLDKLFPNHQLKHRITVLSKLMFSTEELLKEDVLVFITENQVEFVVKQQQELVLANQYVIKTNEDVLYYILFVLEQYQLNPNSAKLTLVGNIEPQSELIVSLKKYVKHLRFASGHKTLNWQYLAGMPQHYNYTLLNRLFCES